MNRNTFTPEVQDYVDPVKKLTNNPNPTDVIEQIRKAKAEKVVTQIYKSPKATKRQRGLAKQAIKELKPKAKVGNSPSLENLHNASKPFNLEQKGDNELARLYKQEFDAEDQNDLELNRAGRWLRENTEMPDVVLAGPMFNGFTQIDGSGMFMSSIMRGYVSGAGGITDLFGTLVNDAASAVGYVPDPAGSTQVLSDYLRAFGEQLRGDSQFVLGMTDKAMGEKSQRTTTERVGEFVGEMGAQLPIIAAASEIIGPAATFGLMKAIGARGRGVDDPLELGKEFAIGAAEGWVFQKLGKTAEWMQKTGTTTSTAGKFFSSKPVAVATQSLAQFDAGVGQEALENYLHPDPKRDWMDYLLGGAQNVLLDPILLPGGSKKAQRAIEAGRKTAEWNGANLELPKAVKPSEFMFDQIPILNSTMENLLAKSKIQYDPNAGVLWVNPHAGVVLMRTLAADPKQTWLHDQVSGAVLEPAHIEQIANLLDGKSRQAQQGIEEMVEPDAEARRLVTMATQFESMAETFLSASKQHQELGKKGLTVVFTGNGRVDKSVIGHEKFHEEQMKLKAEVGEKSIYNLTPAQWLLQHPIGAKAVENMGKFLEDFYPDSRRWTAEVMAFAAQPGKGETGLSIEERGILIGDYLSYMGTSALEGFDASWIDRRVARVAFKRMAGMNLVKVRKDLAGKPVGLVWNKVEPMMMRTGDKGIWKGVELKDAPVIVGTRKDVNRAIVLNELEGRLKESKVKHEDGTPIRVYHGSPNGVEIKELDLGKLNPRDWIKGFFTTQSEEIASGYSKQGGANIGPKAGSNVHPFYLDIRNPLDLETEAPSELIKEWKELRGVESNNETDLSNSIFANISFAPIYGQEILEGTIEYFKSNQIDPQTGMSLREWNAKAQELKRISEGTSQRASIAYENLEKLEQQKVQLKYAIDKKLQEYEIVKTWENSDYHISLKKEIGALLQQEAEITEAISAADTIWFNADKENRAAYSKWREMADGYLDAQNRVPQDYAIEQTRQWLLAQGYDGAFHTGQGNPIKERIYSKSEAEEIAKRTGGKMEELPIYEDRYEIIDRLSKAGYSDLIAAAARYERSDYLPGIINRLGAISELDETTWNRFKESYMPDIDLSYDKVKELKPIVYAQVKEVQYEVRGHRVWIAFKPEQLISATALHPTEGFFGSDLEGFKTKGWKEFYETKEINHPEFTELERVFNAFQTEAGMNSVMESLDIPKSTESGNEEIDPELKLNENTPEEEPNSPSSEDTIKTYKLAEKAYADASRTLNAINRSRRAMGQRSRVLGELKNSGVDVEAQLQAASAEFARLQKLQQEAFKAKKLALSDMRSKWEPIQEAVKQEKIKLAAQEGGEQIKEWTERKEAATKYIEQFEAQLNSDVANAKLVGNNDNIRLFGEISPELWETFQSEWLFHNLIKYGKEILIEAGTKILPTEEMPIHRQLFQALLSGKVDEAKMTAALEKFGMTWPQAVKAFMTASSDAGRKLAWLSHAKRELGKQYNKSPESIQANIKRLEETIPELETFIKANTPTLQEIKTLVHGRSNLNRFVGLRDTALLLSLYTQSRNAIMSGINLVGKSVDNYLNSIENRIRSGEFEKVNLTGEKTIHAMENTTLTDSFQPLFQIVSIANYARKLDGIKWMDKGVTSGRPSERVPRALQIMSDIAEIFPQISTELFGSMDHDIDSMDLTMLGKGLEVMENQVKLEPDSPMKEKKLAEFAKARVRLAREEGKLSGALRGAEGLIHKGMIIGRGPERILRTAAFVGQLEYYAKRYGQNLNEMMENGTLVDLNKDAMAKAVRDALEITYGVQPKRGNSLNNAYYEYMHFIRTMGEGTGPGGVAIALGLRVLQPFQNFLVQAVKQTFEWSPFQALRYVQMLSAQGSNKVLGTNFEIGSDLFKKDGDYSKLNKMLIGSMAYGATWLMAKHKYDEAERKKIPPDHPDWDAVGPLSVKSTPFAAMFFLMDTVERMRRGLPLNERQFKQALAQIGPDFRGVGGVFDWADELFTRFAEGKEIKINPSEDFSMGIGKWFSGFLTPIRNFTDFYTMFDEDQKTLKDIYGWGYGSLVLPSLDKLPSHFGWGDKKISARELLLDRIDPYTGRPMLKSSPVSVIATGFNLVPEHSPLENLLINRGVKPGDWIPFTGVDEVDRELVRNVGSKVLKVNEIYANGKFSNLDLDHQMVGIREVLLELSAEALDETLDKFPDVRLKMEMNEELNFWERRIAEDMRAKKGEKSFSELYEEVKKLRTIKREPLSSDRTQEEK